MTPLLLQVVRVVVGVVTHGTAPSIRHGFRRTRRGNERQAPALALYGGDVVPRIQVEELHGLRVTGLPRCEAPRMDVMRLQSGRAAVVGELDLDFQLVRRDEQIANRAGSPDPAAAPGAIRRPRRQFSLSDRRSRLCSKPRLVTHLVYVVPRRRCAEEAWPSRLGVPVVRRRMGTCRDPRWAAHRPGRWCSRKGRAC